MEEDVLGGRVSLKTEPPPSKSTHHVHFLLKINNRINELMKVLR